MSCESGVRIGLGFAHIPTHTLDPQHATQPHNNLYLPRLLIIFSDTLTLLFYAPTASISRTTALGSAASMIGLPITRKSLPLAIASSTVAVRF